MGILGLTVTCGTTAKHNCTCKLEQYFPGCGRHTSGVHKMILGVHGAMSDSPVPVL